MLRDLAPAPGELFSNPLRLALLELLQEYAAELDGTPLGEAEAVLVDGRFTYAVRTTYARFLTDHAPTGYVALDFHLPDTTVLVAYIRNPAVVTPSWEE